MPHAKLWRKYCTLKLDAITDITELRSIFLPNYAHPRPKAVVKGTGKSLGRTLCCTGLDPLAPSLRVSCLDMGGFGRPLELGKYYII